MNVSFGSRDKAFELTPKGLVRDGDVDRSSPTAVASGQRFDRLILVVLAERIDQLDIICQMYGMAGAAHAAADCLRTGLEEPSRIMPFLDPLLPTYDPVRNTAVFQQLVADLEELMRETRSQHSPQDRFITSAK